MQSLLDLAREKYRPHGVRIKPSGGEYHIWHIHDDAVYVIDDFDRMIRKADELVANPPPKPPPPPGPQARNNHPRAFVKSTNKRNSKTHQANRQRYEKDRLRWKEEQK